MSGQLAAQPDLPVVKQRALKVLERYLDGQSIEQQASEQGITDTRLYALLAQHVPDEWQQAQIGHAMADLSYAKRRLKNPSDHLDLASARDQAKVSMWEHEKLFRRLYGDKLDVHHSGSVAVTRVSFRQIEGEVIQEAPMVQSNNESGSHQSGK